MCRVFKSIDLLLIQGLAFHCPVIFSRSTNFAAPPDYWTSLVRLSESIVSGGSLTIFIITHLSSEDAIPEGQKLPQRAIPRWGSLYGWSAMGKRVKTL